MKTMIEKVEQRGTLLVEAIAMLGLIAMVTPTLYKKSAERLQEIQDINAASQMRTFNQIIETFVSQKMSTIKDEMGNNDVDVLEIVKDNTSSNSNVFSLGYSSVMPFGYRTDEIKNYEAPRVFAHFNKTEQSSGATPTMTTYIIYPHIADPGKKRASRLASLVGANGGMVIENKQIQGTGGAWFLDNSQVTNILDIPDEMLKQNNVVVTSQEPIEESAEDSPKFLYRIFESEGDIHRNTMYTNLYMGGNVDNGRGDEDNIFFSIFNVRKLTMNTKCDYEHTVKQGHYDNSSDGYSCDPRVADLYIGKPKGTYTEDQNYSGSKGLVPANNGAAWIYGNLTAMNEGFKAVTEGNSSSAKGMFLFKPTTTPVGSDSSVVADYALIDAEGDLAGTSSHVKLMGEFVSMTKDSSGVKFVVKQDINSENQDYLVYAKQELGGEQYVKLGMQASSNVYLAPQGGYVAINGASSVVDTSKTVINSGAGVLEMGYQAGWMQASGYSSTANVHILKDGGDTFIVGASSKADALIYGDFDDDGSSWVALNKGRFYIDSTNHNYSTGTQTGGSAGTGYELVDGHTAITTRYVDIMGQTYIGAKTMTVDSSNSDGFYSRQYTLGVAGSAWVDGFLWSRSSWTGEMAARNLHAGVANYATHAADPRKSWLNVYNKDYPNADMSGGGVVIRNPNLISSDTYFNESDVMVLARPGEARVSDTKGAELSLDHGVTRLGSEQNYMWADSTVTSSYAGTVGLHGQAGVYIEATNSSLTSSVVDLQGGALSLYGHPDLANGAHGNKIVANAGVFSLRTGSSLTEGDDTNVHFYVDSDIARTRDLDFAVQRADSSNVFAVNVDSSLARATDGLANVEIDGSIHVTGNDVIHIASNSSNTAAAENSHAMFEIDPNYIRVWSKDSVGNYVGGSSNTDYHALLEINPYDVRGDSTAAGKLNDTSIYIRRGAIELMPSDSSIVGPTDADAGFGYVLANRLVSNAGQVPVTKGGTNTAYDQYMVNPAYTSVMHDIKLTTRGGARLSDVLPDFVLKGVYNVSNDYLEGQNRRISWSAGTKWCGSNSCTTETVAWADPFMGKIPFAMCPPGYANMATIVPISFQIGRSGYAIRAGSYGGANPKGKWMISEPTQQSDILAAALGTSSGVFYPGFEEMKSFNYNDIVNDTSAFSTFEDFVGSVSTVTEGWFYGLPADKLGSSETKTKAELVGTGGRQYWQYTDASTVTHAVASPLYFQSGTFLKTTVQPTDRGWDARMGFIYDKAVWHSDLTDGLDNAGILSNNTDGTDNSSGATAYQGGEFVWNLFPVPTNTLEGHATVYCYFDRTQFNDGGDHQVQQLDMLNSGYNYNDKQSTGSSNAEDYIKRLHDPSLKYNDPW